MFHEEYRDWFITNITDQKSSNFSDYKEIFKMKLNSLEISHLLINDKKDFNLINKILRHNHLFEKIKFLILFFTPKRFFKYLKK